jgi:phosphotransferase system IIB component
MNFYQILGIVGAGLLVLIAIMVALIVLFKKRKNTEVEEFPELLIALGGKENISEVSQKGSRVNVLVDNKKAINKEKIKEQGVETIVISNKKVTMVVGNKNSMSVYNYLNNQINL